MFAMFDRLAKLAAGSSRRDALKRLGAFLTGGFLVCLPSKARADDNINGGGYGWGYGGGYGGGNDRGGACSNGRGQSKHHRHGKNKDNDEGVGPALAYNSQSMCLTYCMPCSIFAGGVFEQCLEHCTRVTTRHPQAMPCGPGSIGLCNPLLPTRFCYGKTPMCWLGLGCV